MTDVTTIIIYSSAFLFAFLFMISIIRVVNSYSRVNYTQEQLDSAKTIDTAIYIVTVILFIVFIVSYLYSVKPDTDSRYRRFSSSSSSIYSDFSDILYPFIPIREEPVDIYEDRRRSFNDIEEVPSSF